MRQLALSMLLVAATLVIAACESPPPEREVTSIPDIPTYEGRTVEEWVGVLRNSEGSSRMAASIALAALEPWSVIPLSEALSSEDPSLRYAAAISLASIGPPAQPADPALVTCLGDPEPRVREAAARAVGNFGQGGTGGVAALGQLLKDENTRVRFHAAEAIMKLGVTDSEVLFLVSQAMYHDRDAEVRRMARAAYQSGGQNRSVDRSGRPIEPESGRGVR